MIGAAQTSRFQYLSRLFASTNDVFRIGGGFKRKKLLCGANLIRKSNDSSEEMYKRGESGNGGPCSNAAGNHARMRLWKSEAASTGS